MRKQIILHIVTAFLPLSMLFMTFNAQAQENHSMPSEPILPSPALIQDFEPQSSPWPEARVEQIHIDEGGAQIDELRIQGQTRSIQVKPQGNLPPYQVKPRSDSSSDDRSEGKSQWHIFSF